MPSSSTIFKLKTKDDMSLEDETDPSIDDWLDEIEVGEMDVILDAIDPAVPVDFRCLRGWWYVSDRNGDIAFLPTETDACRYRLDYINRRMNP